MEATTGGAGSVVWKGIKYRAKLLKEGLSWEPSNGEELQPFWKGRFITKYAYEVVCGPEVREGFNWKHLWNFKGLVRSSLTLWTAAHD